jgi:pimeloyl-ACP methyl ester carboxylesterase
VEVVDVQVGGTRICVKRWGEGSGPGILYWHGGGGGSGETPVLAPPLVKAGYTVHAVDAPGYGASPPLSRDGYGSARLAGLAAGLLDRLEVAPVIWIGYSWGASIGVHTAARFPESVRALGLLDGGYLVAQDDPDYNPDSDFEDELAELRRLADEGESWDAPDDVIAAAMVGSRREPCTPLYPDLRTSGIPVLLAHATEPPDLQALRRIALDRFRNGVPDARMVPIPGATHGVFEDNAPELIRVVLAWLSGLD